MFEAHILVDMKDFDLKFLLDESHQLNQFLFLVLCCSLNHINFSYDNEHGDLKNLRDCIVFFLDRREVNIRFNYKHIIVRVEAHQTEYRVLHLIFVAAQIDHLNDLGTLCGNLPLYLLAVVMIRVVHVLAAGDLLQVLIKSDNLVFGLCRLSAYLLMLLIVHLVPHDPEPVISDPRWCRQQLGQGSLATI